MREMASRWAGPLAAFLGRSVDEIERRGLGATDFPQTDVEVEFRDGSWMRFRHAFVVIDDNGRVGVFTEHCGHYEFARRQATFHTVHRTTLWPEDDDSV
jgi:hypothetical protein